MKWSGFCFLVIFPLSSLHRLYFHGGPSMRGRQSWLGRHDSTLRPNPHLFLHTVVVMMEVVSEKLTERESERHREVERQREKVWSGIVEMSRQVRMHWFHITFLLHFTRRMLPFWENAILISRLRPNICTIQIGGYGGNVIQTWNMALSSYPAQPHWCFWAFHCSAKMKSFKVGATDRLRKHILFCRTWQRLSCYLNNMSSAEVARKHCLWKHCVVKLLGEFTAQSHNENLEPWTWKWFFTGVVTSVSDFFSFSFITLQEEKKKKSHYIQLYNW